MVTKVKGLARAHPFVLVACILLLVGAASAAWVITSIYRVDSSVVYFGVPDAPQLTAGPGQTLYRVNASRSSVTYGIDEELAGTTHRATGSTKGIAGDIVIDEANPSASQVGDIVVNVQQLTSDQSIRDERIRHEGLQSNDLPVGHAPHDVHHGHARPDRRRHRLLRAVARRSHREGHDGARGAGRDRAT